MWFPFNFAKKLKIKGPSFCGGQVKELEIFNKHLFWCQLSKKCIVEFSAIFVCCQDELSNSEINEIASSTTRKFNNSSLLYIKFSETIKLPKYLTDKKLKISAVSISEIKGTKKDKIFHFFKSSFSVMHVPMDMIFGVFSETYARLLTSISSQFLSRYSKSYDNLDVKKCLKLNDP